MGVHFEKAKGKWRARYWVNGKQLHVGMYKSELAAKQGLTKFKNKRLEQIQTWNKYPIATPKKRNWVLRIFG